MAALFAVSIGAFYTYKTFSQINSTGIISQEDNKQLQDKQEQAPKDQTNAAANKVIKQGNDTTNNCEDCSKSIANTVKLYDRHMIICGYDTIVPSHIERENAFIEKLQHHLSAMKNKPTIKITASDHPNSTATFTDVIVYPEQLVITVNPTSDYDVELLAQYLSDPALTNLTLPYHDVHWKRLILVCIHAARDKRCGKIGPQVIDELRTNLSSRGLTENDICVRGSSHVGGHEWAGILLVYPECDWYGYITKRNVSELIDNVLAGTRLEKCWRGRGSKYDW